MQTRSAHLVLLDERYGHAQFGGAESTGITSAASAEDHDVEVVRHGALLEGRRDGHTARSGSILPPGDLGRATVSCNGRLRDCR